MKIGFRISLAILLAGLSGQLTAGVFSKSTPPQSLLSSEISYFTGYETGKIQVQAFIDEFKAAGYPTVSESWEEDDGYWVYTIKKRDPVTKSIHGFSLQFNNTKLDRLRMDNQDVRDPTAITAVIGGLVKSLPSQARRVNEKQVAQEKKSSDQFSQLMIMDESGKSDYGISINDLIENFELLGRKVVFTKSPGTGDRVLKTKLDGGQDFEMEFNESSIVAVGKDGRVNTRKAADLWRVAIAGKSVPKEKGHIYLSGIAKALKEERSQSAGKSVSH